MLNKEISLKDETNKAGLVIAFAVVVVLFLLFGGGALTGATLSNGKMGSGLKMRYPAPPAGLAEVDIH